jgi:hypothetical protein
MKIIFAGGVIIMTGAVYLSLCLETSILKKTRKDIVCLSRKFAVLNGILAMGALGCLIEFLIR